MSIKNVDDAIRCRKTEKLMSETNLPARDHRATLNEIMSLGGAAPFHRACEEFQRNQTQLGGIEPWRFHAIDAFGCRALRAKLPRENAGKVPTMLATADALVMATWLPNEYKATGSPLEWNSPNVDTSCVFEPSLSNLEHIAAASAAIQNLLLAATGRGIPNYWSSGGILRTRTILELLEIPPTEILLGAIYFFPKDSTGVERVGSKLRECRSPLESWSRWVELDGTKN